MTSREKGDPGDLTAGQ